MPLSCMSVPALERERPRKAATDVEVFPARTPTLLPATHTNSYALGSREILLVEPATPYLHEQREWLAWAEGLRATGRVLRGIFVTHHHVDHVGGAAVLSGALGVPLLAHAATAARADLPNVELLGEGARLVLDGPTPTAWRVLHTPGHAPGHLCLHEEDRGLLIVGDMVASVGSILIAPGDGDMIAYLDQLARLADLDASVALPAHGEPIEGPRVLFEKYVQHRLMRERVVLDAVKIAGASGARFEDVLPVAYADVPVAVLPIAALSLQAHLDKLLVEGRVREHEHRLFCVSEAVP